MFKQRLNSHINVTNLENTTTEQVENTTLSCIKTIKNTMELAIPKSNYHYPYQLKITEEIKKLETQYRTLIEFAEHFGWTIEIYREQHRIKIELRERCKESYNKKWEDKIKYISENSKNSKDLWNKI